MNTHVLIPIEDIEAKIKELENTYTDYTDWEGKLSELKTYKSLLLGKQISLDDKDIEEKADQFGKSWQRIKNSEEFLSNPEKYKGRYDGYKQALLDIKKELL